MLIDDFVTANETKLIGEIARIRNHLRLTPIQTTYTHQDLVRWILNDNELYQWAIASGVEGI